MAKAPRFQVEVIHNREVKATLYTKNPNKDKDGVNFIVEETSEVIPVSFMVYFPGGHSLWFPDKAAMAAAGIIEDANYEIDLDTGLPVDPEQVVNLKAHVEKNTRHRKHVGG